MRSRTGSITICWGWYRAGNGEPPGAEPFGGERLLGPFDRSLMTAAIGGTPGPDVRPPEDTVAVVLYVPDVGRSHAELARMGIRFVQPPTDRKEWSLRTAHLRDPDGNLVELSQNLPWA